MTTRKSQAAKKVAKKASPAKKTANKRLSAVVSKKAATKKTVSKSVKSAAKPMKKTDAKLSVVKSGPIVVGKKAFTKSQFVSTISEQSAVSKKEVELVLSSVSKVINAHLKKQGPRTFSWPGLFKIVVVKKPATPERWGVNPFTKEKMKFAAKPASLKVRVRPLKALKEMVL